MKKLSLVVLVVLLSLSTSFKSHAAIVQYDGITGFATGITDLDINGTLYDVTFNSGSYDGIFGVTPPVFMFDAVGSEAAADAITAVMAAEIAPPVLGNTMPSDLVWVPYNVNATNFFSRQIGHNQPGDPWQRFANFTGDRTIDWVATGRDWLFASFTRAAVPLPSSISMILLGFALMLSRRKR